MTIHRCDVCRTEFTSAEKVTRVQARLNLYALVDANEPNFVLVELDLCASPSCRRTGLKQATEATLLMALERLGLPAHPKAV